MKEGIALAGRVVAALMFGAAIAVSAVGAARVSTQANVMAEIAFTAAGDYADPFNQVQLDVVFTAPGGAQLRVPAFWAGGKVWKVRYASPTVGRHAFRSECSVPQDQGLQAITGEVEIRPYSGSNPLYTHGPLRVAAGGRYLEHQDHTPFFWLGDTWWMGLCHRLEWPAEFQKLAADRKEKGFNVVQIVAGLYPDMPPFDPRGANEAGFPWETNYTAIRPAYFDAADARLGYLVEQGITPCLVGAWGYFMPWMGVEKMKAHWRYLIARYGASPVVWCAAGEANLPWYLAPGFPYDDRKQVTDWTEVMAFIRRTDPYHRLLTIHPTAIKRFTARHATDDERWLDFDMLQTPHGRAEAVPVVLKAVRESYTASPRMPVIDGEASYEMLSDSLPTEWTRRMFWLCLMNGAAGHTYGANGIWQCNRPGQPHGKSPHGGSYGVISWEEAMRLPGSRQLGLAKAFFEQYPWPQFQPHPEWVAADLAPVVDPRGCSWIWFPEGNPATDAPAEKRFFRRAIALPEDKSIERASLWLSADDAFSARVNGQSVGGGEDWRVGRQFDGLERKLHGGTNVLSVVAENKPAPGPDPAGLIGCLEVVFKGGETQRWVTDGQWRCAKQDRSNWESAGFDDTQWASAMVAGRYGDGPWGEIGHSGTIGAEPQATGIPNSVRMIYVPVPEAIQIRALSPGGRYATTIFDPVTGGKTNSQAAAADGQGNWRCPAPPGVDHDWVVLLTPE